ncbi:hypothetical protein [Amycolatopsis sp. NPDC003731]
MSPIDHLIVTVIGARRARAEERRPTPRQAGRPAGAEVSARPAFRYRVATP